MNPGCWEQAETAGGNESMKEENRILESAHAPPLACGSHPGCIVNLRWESVLFQQPGERGKLVH